MPMMAMTTRSSINVNIDERFRLRKEATPDTVALRASPGTASNSIKVNLCFCINTLCCWSFPIYFTKKIGKSQEKTYLLHIFLQDDNVIFSFFLSYLHLTLLRQRLGLIYISEIWDLGVSGGITPVSVDTFGMDTFDRTIDRELISAALQGRFPSSPTMPEAGKTIESSMPSRVTASGHFHIKIIIPVRIGVSELLIPTLSPFRTRPVIKD